MRRAIQFGFLLLLASAQLPAAELANLRNGFNIRHEHHEAVGDKTRLYLGSNSDADYIDLVTADIEGFVAAPPDVTSSPAAPVAQRDLARIVGDASTRSRIDADFIASVIHAESGNNPRAVSPKGARGLMQLMPQTARTLGVKDSFDPAENVDGGVRYLRELLVQYNGDAAKALAAYNAGPHRVQQYGGVPPYRETHAYVAHVINDYNRKKAAEAKRQTHSSSSAGRDVATNSTNSGGK